MNNEGRPQKLATEQLLKAIAKECSTRSKVLAVALGVSQDTVQRRIKELSTEQIDTALGKIASKTVTAINLDYSVFYAIPSVKDWRESLRYLKKNTQSYTVQMLRSLHRTCIDLATLPDNLTPEMCKDLLLKIRKQEVQRGEYDFKRGVRSWFGFKGISGQRLSNLGISSSQETENRSRMKLSAEQRYAFMVNLYSLTSLNFTTMQGNTPHTVAFQDQPILKHAMRFLPDFLFNTGARIGDDETKEESELSDEKLDYKTGALNVDWSSVEHLDEIEHRNVIVVNVLDKCKLKWAKQLIGPVRDNFVQFWQNIGKPTSGLMFPFTYDEVRKFFKACYQEAKIDEIYYKGMPCHIWRHTAAQELLWVTHYNYELVAATLGWKDTKVLKDHYGAMPDDERALGLMLAMGLPVKTEVREFKFLLKPLPKEMN